MDPFDVLGIEARFDVDLDQLHQRHRQLAKALHPDKFVGRGASERRMALSKSIEVNDALRIVQDPVRRAEALLARLGIDASDESSTATDPVWLMDIMEQREALVQAQQAKDKSALQSLQSQMRQRETQLLQQLSEAFASHAPSAKAPLSKLRFVRRFIEQASLVEDELL